MKYILKLMLFLTLTISVSCQSDDTPKIYEEGTNEYINQWMYQQMKKYYYWSNTIPGQGDLSSYPKEYFAQLLQHDDPFSYAIHPSIAQTFPKRMKGLYGFDISFVVHQGVVYGVVLYVLSDSPAYNSGIKRGMLIKAINGTVLNQENYEGLYNDLVDNEQGQLEVVEYSAETGFSTPRQVNIFQGFTFSQPILHRVIDKGENKVGYIEISHFDSGMAQSLLEIFLEFKNQSVNNVVVDLRYNGGGDVSSAAALSIILAPVIQAGDLFITFKGNKNGGNVSQSFQEALEMNESQLSFQELRNAHFPIEKLYILCGSHTASASEIIINNLKPYMEVVTIGEKTVGKDVAGFAIEDNRISGELGWVLYPAIYKLYNADNEGNYSTGITPTIELDELSGLQIFPLGDPNESLLQMALNTISGNGRMTPAPKIKKLPLLNTNPAADPIVQINR